MIDILSSHRKSGGQGWNDFVLVLNASWLPLTSYPAVVKQEAKAGMALTQASPPRVVWQFLRAATMEVLALTALAMQVLCFDVS